MVSHGRDPRIHRHQRRAGIKIIHEQFRLHIAKRRAPRFTARLAARPYGKLHAFALDDASHHHRHFAAKAKLAEFGIDLLDVRFKRINYNQSVVEKIYDRMISERQQIASRFRSEGEGEAAKILGNKERELSVVESEAYEKVQRIRGEADAKAIEIYAQAYGQTEEAREFYEFLKTMETLRSTANSDTSIVLSTDSEFYRFLKGSQ
jgi:membrane protease subunit HflC